MTTIVTANGFSVDGLPLRTLAQALVGINTNNAGYAPNIQVTGGAPNIAAGTQILSMTITPKKVGSLIVIESSVFGTLATNSDWMSSVLWIGSTLGNVCGHFLPSADSGVIMKNSAEFISTSLDPITIQVRVGCTANSWRLNGNGSGAFWGLVGNATKMTIKEYV